MQRNSTSVAPPAVTPADAADHHSPRTMPLVSELGRGPKPQYISAVEHLFPFGGAGYPAPTCFCIFLSCHITWQFILGSAGWHLRHKADKALVVTSMRPVGATRMPLAVRCHKMDNTAPHILAKCEERHQLFAQFRLCRGGKKQHAVSKCEAAAGWGGGGLGRSSSDYWTCLKSEPPDPGVSLAPAQRMLGIDPVV